ncbi:MAG: hypothetical protein V7L25_16165 [Nostoc sp.]
MSTTGCAYAAFLPGSLIALGAPTIMKLPLKISFADFSSLAPLFLACGIE